MNQRELNLDDYEEIDKIWRAYYSQEFGLPPVDNNTLYTTVIEQYGEVVGFGHIRQTAESLMIIDQSLSKKVRIEIVKQILEKQIEGMIVKDIKECHAFAQNHKFAKMLRKHFHYVPVIGESLVLRLEKGNGETRRSRDSEFATTSESDAESVEAE